MTFIQQLSFVNYQCQILSKSTKHSFWEICADNTFYRIQYFYVLFYGYETQCFTFWRKHFLKVFEKRAKKNIWTWGKGSNWMEKIAQ